jgi:hypothetical protein
LAGSTPRFFPVSNTCVAHQEKEITDPKEAQQHLVGWIKGLKALTNIVASEMPDISIRT